MLKVGEILGNVWVKSVAQMDGDMLNVESWCVLGILLFLTRNVTSSGAGDIQHLVSIG